MTQLNFNYYFSTSCKIKIENATSVKSLSNPGGFLPTGYTVDNTSVKDSRNYTIDESYLFTAIVYNPFGKTPVVESVYKTKLSDPVGTDTQKIVSSNVIHPMSNDGHYTIAQFVAIDKAVYNANYNSTRFNGNNYIVTDGTYLYYTNTLINEQTLKISVLDLIKITNIEATGMIALKTVFSTCKLYACFIKQVETKLIEKATACQAKAENISNVLVLYCTISAIKYRVQLCEYELAQKYVEWIAYCGNYCNNIISNTLDCNCG